MKNIAGNNKEANKE